MTLFEQGALFLAAAVVAVPICSRLGLSSVLGYLLAGIAIGPSGFNLFGEVDEVLNVAQLGVVLMVFIIGLELQPARLWSMRRSVFLLGGAQMAATTAALTPIGLLLGLDLLGAVVSAYVFALSCTAFALQYLAERGQLTSRYGRNAFGILLFQDLAVLPLLAIVPVLARGADGLDPWSTALALGEVALVLGVFILAGRQILGLAMRVIAGTGLREVFTATALLTVVGSALLMNAVGLSMALGAFLAGVLLAESEFRHELEADIEPFKGLLLGLFFMAVGMSVAIEEMISEPLLIAGLVFGLMAVKTIVLTAIGRLSGLDWLAARRLGLVLSQGGEFAFVVFALAAREGLLPGAVAERFILVVTLSIAATPLVMLLHDALSAKPAQAQKPYEAPPAESRHVIIAGFGRFGQIMARVLHARGIPFTALEIDPEQVALVRRFGNQAFYGDGSRLDLLRAAGAQKAAAFVIAMDDVQASLRAAEVARTNFPQLPIYARARNRRHAHLLMKLGVEMIRRETLLSSLDLTRSLLIGLGLSEREAHRLVETFQRHDERRLREQLEHHSDLERLAQETRKDAEELADLFRQDAEELDGGATADSREERKA